MNMKGSNLARSLNKRAAKKVLIDVPRRLQSSAVLYDEYLQRSYLPTYHFQNCLPRLPVPKLEDTAARYARSLQALNGHPEVDEFTIKDTERAIKLFVQNDGPQLQKVLLSENSKPDTNYICQPWFDMYLESRLPIPLNFNPFLKYIKDPVHKMNDQATRSVNFIMSALRFERSLYAENLEPEVFYVNEKTKGMAWKRLIKRLPNAGMVRYLAMAGNSAYPLDMSQFANLFNSTRIPRQGRDEIKSYPQSNHVIVLRNGHFYKLLVRQSDGRSCNPELMKAGIQHILADQRPPPEYPVSYLTTTDRNVWADAREHLLSTGNASALNDIDSALFCLVLEGDHDTETEVGATAVFLHGDGGNRWFDKSFSLIITQDGDSAINFEHSWGDGVAVVRFFNEAYEDTTQNPAIDYAAAAGQLSAELVSDVKFNLDEKSKDSIEEAKTNYFAATSSLSTNAGKNETFTKSYLKSKKVSPDGVAQLAIQVGHLRVYGHPAATYESCSTSAFRRGRTETVRSCTVEAQAAAKAIVEGRALSSNNKLKSDAEFRANVEHLIRESCKKHNELTTQAAMGQGFDRHLFGLKYSAEKILGMPTPGLFKDPSYSLMNHIILSTSTLNTDYCEMGGFAPVVPNGFGVGYGVRKKATGVNITSYDGTDGAQLVDAIVESYHDLQTVLDGSKS